MTERNWNIDDHERWVRNAYHAHELINWVHWETDGTLSDDCPCYIIGDMANGDYALVFEDEHDLIYQAPAHEIRRLA